MSQVGTLILSNAITFAASIIVSTFASGVRWGRTEATIETIKRDLAEIKGMFTLRLKD